MIQIREIDHIVLRVLDLEAMARFYCEVLGCSVERRRDDIGLLQLRAGASLVDLVPVDGQLGRMGGASPGPEGRNLDHVCFEGEGPSIYLADPEGNTVELKGPPGSRV
jgi:glyoxylase I family protein